MSLNTLDVKLTPRTGISVYNVDLTGTTWEILTLIFEFRLATSWHLSRLVSQKEKDNYIYAKLRRMWQAGLVESFRVFTGSRLGIPIYYMLSKKGLKLLENRGLYEPRQLKNYPKAKTLLSWGLFKHESQIVEMASLESLNISESLILKFKGEDSSQFQDVLNDKPVEVLTPDYTAIYKSSGVEYTVYTEYERTKKSNDVLLSKVQRYLNFLGPEKFQTSTLRLIFETPGMERSFWLNIFLNRPSLLRLKIVTTSLNLITEAKQFVEPVYATEETVKLSKDGGLKITIPQRVKLFDFL